MRTRPSYVIIQYSPDLAAGERLNVGVALLDINREFCRVELDARTARLSDAFGHFSAKDYKIASAALRQRLLRAFERQRSRLPGLDASAPAISIASIFVECIQDESLSFKVMPERYIASYAEPSVMLDHLFERYVSAGQHVRKTAERRKDQDVWRDTFARELRRYDVAHKLEEKTVALPKLPPLKFEHSFKNGVWRVMQPVSFDLADGDSIRDKAFRWWGNSSALKNHSDIQHLYFLLGKPEEPSLLDAYQGAIDYLSESEMDITVVEEAEAGAFASQIAALVH